VPVANPGAAPAPPSKPDADELVVASAGRTGAVLELTATGSFNGAKLNCRVVEGPETGVTVVVAPASFVSPKQVPLPDPPLQAADDVIVQADFTVVQPATGVAATLLIKGKLTIDGQTAEAWDTVTVGGGQPSGKLTSLSFLVVKQ
jgi:hypothetical protein